MTDSQESVKEQAKRAAEMIETQLGGLRELITLYIRPGKGIEPLNQKIASERFRQWRSKTSRVLSEQINAGTGQDFERRVDRAAGFARSAGLEMMEQMDMAQQFLESLKVKLRYHPEQVFAGSSD